MRKKEVKNMSETLEEKQKIFEAGFIEMQKNQLRMFELIKQVSQREDTLIELVKTQQKEIDELKFDDKEKHKDKSDEFSPKKVYLARMENLPGQSWVI